MTTFAVILGFAVAFLGLVAWVLRRQYSQGKDAQRADNQEEVLDDLEKAKRARDNLRADIAARKRLREKFKK
jgi:hypothetical protein